MTTVYVVASGSYSDYRIDAIFDTREAAETYAVGGAREIEEHELNTIAATERLYWKATLGRDWGGPDRTLTAIRVDPSPELFDTAPPAPTVSFYPHKDYGWLGTAYGKSPDHARKILADTWAQAKAELAATEPDPR